MQASEQIVSAMVRRQYGDKMTQLKKLEKDNRSLRVWLAVMEITLVAVGIIGGYALMFL